MKYDLYSSMVIVALIVFLRFLLFSVFCILVLIKTQRKTKTIMHTDLASHLTPRMKKTKKSRDHTAHDHKSQLVKRNNL